MDNDILLQDLSRITCPVCAGIGVSSLSFVTKDTPYPGSVFCCSSDSSHLWIYTEQQKAVITERDGETCLSYHEMASEEDEELFEVEDSLALILAFDPNKLTEVILKKGLVREAEAILKSCEDMIKQDRAFEFATTGFTVPEEKDSIVVWTGGIQIEAKVLTVKNVYLDIALLGDVKTPFLVGVFCEPVLARTTQNGSAFDWSKEING